VLNNSSPTTEEAEDGCPSTGCVCPLLAVPNFAWGERQPCTTVHTHKTDPSTVCATRPRDVRTNSGFPIPL